MRTLNKKSTFSTFKKSTFKKGRAKNFTLKKRKVEKVVLAQPFLKVEKVDKNKNDIFFHKRHK
jgi:hypothetical protein